MTGRGDERFALDSLGLPIVFKRQGPTVHADQVSGARPVILRRASPLWLRPVVEDDKRWKLFWFAFQGDFLPAGAAVHVWPDNAQPGREMTVTSDDLVARTDTWITAMRAGSSFVREPELR